MPFILSALSYLAKYWWQIGLALIVAGLFLKLKYDAHEIKSDTAIIATQKTSIATLTTNLAGARASIDTQNTAIEKAGKDAISAQEKMTKLGDTITQMDKTYTAKINKLTAVPAPESCEDTSVYLNNMALELRWSKK